MYIFRNYLQKNRKGAAFFFHFYCFFVVAAVLKTVPFGHI